MGSRPLIGLRHGDPVELGREHVCTSSCSDKWEKEGQQVIGRLECAKRGEAFGISTLALTFTKIKVKLRDQSGPTHQYIPMLKIFSNTLSL